MDARERAKELLERTDLTPIERRNLDGVLSVSTQVKWSYYPLLSAIEKRLADEADETLFCQVCGQHREPGEDDMDPDDCGGISLCDPCRADIASQISQGRKSAICQFCEDQLLMPSFEEPADAEYGMCLACKNRLDKLDVLVECDGCHAFVHEDHTSSVCIYRGSYYEPPEYARICEKCNQEDDP